MMFVVMMNCLNNLDGNRVLMRRTTVCRPELTLDGLLQFIIDLRANPITYCLIFRRQ